MTEFASSFAVTLASCVTELVPVRLERSPLVETTSPPIVRSFAMPMRAHSGYG